MRAPTARDRLAVLQRAQPTVTIQDPERPRSGTAAAESVAAAAAAVSIAAQMLAILSAPAAAGEPAAVAYGRKEAALVTLFAQMSPEDAADLRQRLAESATDDVGKAFNRLATERRLRLLDYLAAADRRHLRATGRPYAAR